MALMASFTTKLRSAWDGATLRNTTKEETQEVRAPAMVLHCHVTPSDWSKYVDESEAAGGSYNRILPFLLGSVPLLDDDRVSLPKVDGRELSAAYAWATARPRVITLGEDARPPCRIVRRYARILGEALPEGQAAVIERTAEQTLSVAACLAASECSETITEERLRIRCRPLQSVSRAASRSCKWTPTAQRPRRPRNPRLNRNVRLPSLTPTPSERCSEPHEQTKERPCHSRQGRSFVGHRRRLRDCSSARSAELSIGRYPGQDCSAGSATTSQHAMQRITPERSGSLSTLPPHWGHCSMTTP